ncbi:MAG: phage terminase large subunit [Bacteroidales bacterium]|nr:phage terminase large subunit [Bacteroidales bacterium]
MEQEIDKQQAMSTMLDNPTAAMRKLVQSSFYYFLLYFWDEYSQEDFKDNWHIPYICNELQVMAERVAAGLPKEYDLLINVPPGSTKTCIVSIMFPAWCWTRWYWMRFITAAYTSTLSLESAEFSRDIIKSAKFKDLFPELEVKRDKDIKSNFRIVKREKRPGTIDRQRLGGNRFSTSVDGTLMGFHGNIQIVDDPLDPKRASAETILDSTNRWVTETLFSRKVDKNVTPLILIMQRLHQNDTTGSILDRRSDKVKHICIPGEIRNYREQVHPPELVEKYKDDLMDPKRLSWEVLEEFEAEVGQYAYSGQIGQKPVPPGGGMFKVDMISYLRELPNPVHILKSVRYWDKAATQGGGTYTVGVKMHQIRQGKWIISDVKRGQWATGVREQLIRSTAESDGPNVEVWVEQEPGSGGKESAEATIRNLAGFSVFADKVTGDKVRRADAYSVQVNNGNIQLIEDHWNKEFINEHRFFPYSTYKDQVDAAAGAFAKLMKNREVIIW